MVFVKVNDVAAELGRTIVSPETGQVEAWIGRVENRIRVRIPDLDDRLLDTVFAATFKGVVVEVVIRKIKNPDGFRSERIDDYYYDRGAQTADLWPTDAEWAELIPLGGEGAFSTRPRFEP